MTFSLRVLPGVLMAATIVVAPLIVAPAALAADEAQGDAVAEKYAVLLERDYVYPETGKRYAAAIRAGIAAGRYATLTGEALGQALDHRLCTAMKPPIRAKPSGAKRQKWRLLSTWQTPVHCADIGSGRGASALSGTLKNNQPAIIKVSAERI